MAQKMAAHLADRLVGRSAALTVDLMAGMKVGELVERSEPTMVELLVVCSVDLTVVTLEYRLVDN